MNVLSKALLALAALCLLPGLAAAAPNTSAELTAAFKAASCGDVIAVMPGVVQKWRPGTPTWDCRANPVTITAADPANPPRFTGGVTGDKWSGVTFRGVTFDIRDGGAESSTAVLLYAGGGISFEGNTFVGLSEPSPTAAGATSLGGIGYGISARGVTGLRVVGNTFRDLPKGLVLLDVTGALVADNDMTGITTDNIQFGGLVGGEIVRNLFLKKALPDTSGAHPDCVQGVESSRPSVNVLIANNLCRGTAVGKASQGYFVEGPANDNIAAVGNVALDLAYRAVTIEGLNVTANDNVALSQRTVDYAGIYWPVGATGTIAGNTANRFIGLPADSVGNVVAARSTAAEIDAAQAAWMAKFRAEAPAPEPEVDPRDAEIAALKAQIATLTGRVDALTAQVATATTDVAALKARVDRLLAERARALELAKLARAAKAKNQYLDPLIALLSAPAP